MTNKSLSVDKPNMIQSALCNYCLKRTNSKHTSSLHKTNLKKTTMKIIICPYSNVTIETNAEPISEHLLSNGLGPPEQKFGIGVGDGLANELR